MYHSLTRTSLSEAILMCKVGHTQGRWEQRNTWLWCVLLPNHAQFMGGCIMFVHDVCGERSVRKWVRRSWQAGRRVRNAQQQEMLRLKPHKASVEPGQTSCLLVSGIIFILLLFHWTSRCLVGIERATARESASSGTVLQGDRSVWDKIPAAIRIRKRCHLCFLCPGWKFQVRLV